MSMIKGYPEGSDITVIDTVYTRPRKDDTTGKWKPSTIDIIFKDNITELKHHQVIDDPMFEFYMTNDDVYLESNVFPKYLPKELLHPVRCKYSDVKKTIAELTGKIDVYYDNIRNGNSQLNNLVHLDNRLYRSDMHIEDFYRYEFGKRYKNTITPPHKAYLDIETDSINAVGDFGTPQDSPINAVTCIDMKYKESHTFLLRDQDNPQCKQFEDDLSKDQEGFIANIKNLIIEHVGGWKNATRFDIIDLKYNFHFYNEEIAMLYDLYAFINLYTPDFLLAWNMAFDVPFIIERIKVLGYDPLDIMRHQDFDSDVLYYYVDEKNINAPDDAGDYARIPCYTVHIDQMKQFAQRRKGQSNYPSNKLDDIADIVAGIRKYDFHDIAPSVVELPRANYFIFVLYNILDVICQVCIESKTNDISFLFTKCVTMNVRYSKAYRQTVYEYTIAAKQYEERNGVIIGNNYNKFNKRPDRKFKGAYVADDRLNHSCTKRKINGFDIEVYDNADDFDYKALYPSTIRENNMAEENQIGKIFIPKPLHDKDNRFGDIRYDRGGAFIEDFQSHLWLEFCERWLHLAGYADLIDDIKEFFDTQATISYPIEYHWVDGLPIINPMIKANGLKQPFKRIDQDQLDKGFMKYKQPGQEMTILQQEYLYRMINGENGGPVYLCKH